MANYNKVLLMGNLTRDPELRYTPSGTPVASFGLAVNRRFKRQDGEQSEETCFVDITAFGRQAEVVSEYLAKGRPVFVEGRLHQESWETQDGQKRTKLSVTLEKFEFLGGRGQDGGGSGGGQDSRSSQRPARRPQPAQQEGPAGPPADSGSDDFADDDIPF